MKEALSDERGSGRDCTSLRTCLTYREQRVCVCGSQSEWDKVMSKSAPELCSLCPAVRSLHK